MKPLNATVLTGLTVVIKDHDNIIVPLFRCEGGFGCQPESSGKVFGRYLQDGEESYIRRSEIERVADDGDMKRLRAWEALSPQSRWKSLRATEKRRTCASFEDLQERFLSSNKPTKQELLHGYNALWRQYRAIEFVFDKHIDHIADVETAVKEETNNNAHN